VAGVVQRMDMRVAANQPRVGTSRRIASALDCVAGPYLNADESAYSKPYLHKSCNRPQ